MQVLDVLSCAHQEGIVHRDIKPNNIFLARSNGSTSNLVKIPDFYVASYSGASAQLVESLHEKQGVLIGTPYYMSPEQAKGALDVDHRTDIYSLGVTLYEAVTGVLPFNAETFNDLIFAIVLDSPVHVREREPSADHELAEIIMRAMAREPAQRYQTATGFREALIVWQSKLG